MKKANIDIRIAKGFIPNWMIADKLEIHEVTFVRWMRKEMQESTKLKVLRAISELREDFEISRRSNE